MSTVFIILGVLLLLLGIKLQDYQNSFSDEYIRVKYAFLSTFVCMIACACIILGLIMQY